LFFASILAGSIFNRLLLPPPPSTTLTIAQALTT
jgi:hypothetical protein